MLCLKDTSILASGASRPMCLYPTKGGKTRESNSPSGNLATKKAPVEMTRANFELGGDGGESVSTGNNASLSKLCPYLLTDYNDYQYPMTIS